LLMQPWLLRLSYRQCRTYGLISRFANMDVALFASHDPNRSSGAAEEIDDDNCASKDGTTPELDRKVKGLPLHSTCRPRAGWCHVEGRVARAVSR
jgi:hypothetical protein